MKQVFLLLTPLQIIYIAVAIMTAVSVAAYNQNTVSTNQNTVPTYQNDIQYQQPTTNPDVVSSPTPSPGPVAPSYSLSPTQAPIITAKIECEGGTIRVCEAGYCECVTN